MTVDFGAESYYADQTFKGITWERSQLVSVEFDECTFIDCSFVESQFVNCKFSECTFQRCDLTMAQLAGSLFASPVFEESKLVGIDWTLAAWPPLRLQNALRFSRCAMGHSTFIGLKLSRMQLTDCTAANVDFREADLSKVDFSGTDLSASMFHHTELAGADLSRARNYQIRPADNNLKGAKFSLPEAITLLQNLGIKLVD